MHIGIKEQSRVGLLKELCDFGLFVGILEEIDQYLRSPDGRPKSGMVYVFSMEAWP